MKSLYKYASEHVDMPDFVRLHDAPAGDKANIFLNHGNYLAYGLAAVTLWILGIPHGFAVMHGKARRCPAAGFALVIAANSSGWWETATNSMKKAWCRSIQREKISCIISKLPTRQLIVVLCANSLILFRLATGYSYLTKILSVCQNTFFTRLASNQHKIQSQ